MTPEEIKELRELEAKATKGEWRITYEPYEDGTPYCSVYAGRGFDGDGFNFTGIFPKEDGELIVSARNALPKLLDEVERLQLDNVGHGCALDTLRRSCGLKSGESYSEVDDYISDLTRKLKLLQEVRDVDSQMFDEAVERAKDGNAL